MAIAAKSKLFQAIKFGDVQLKHRAVLAPLTRFRVDDKHVPLSIAKEYYAQRASQPGTLLITEATLIHPKTGGFANVPGIWSDAQIEAWKEVTDSVHSKGSFIYLQLWALGRAAQPSQLHSEDPSYPYISASDVPLKSRTHEAPRPLTKAEIEEYKEFYAQAAKNAIERAGFDGVEVHGANGYLIDQFIQDMSNHRTDEYGGSIENRSRFALEVLDAVVKAVGPRKTGIRLSPWSGLQDMRMQDPKPQFTHLVTEIKKAHPTFGFIHVVEPRVDGHEIIAEIPKGWDNDFIREIWTLSPGGDDTEDGRRLISAGNHDLESGTRFADEKGDLIAYGRRFISNPDLPYRLLHNIPLTPYDKSTFYIPGSSDPKGYTDYPFAERAEPVAQVSTHL
ncbi:flavin oxidoreductase nadh oxidase [Moniliophthora roreri]|uniref:NADH:flavin oxidoreductase/NADH oxidase N-terminal domain-containing protein n=1 Tax=Moniliophthora roreri TaxID=221103 RepID=A0A0W0FS16_MONRR|nr:flavin oxidoreductase nadh oxidase [Moniliophthora roreri]